jgi:hypothetical protein
MSKRLIENITSQYIEAANSLTSRNASCKIVAYVESYDDVFFWRTILSQLENDKLCFEVMLPTHEKILERGKKAAITSMLEGLGKNMIACVDADYDYLKDGRGMSSYQMLHNPFIFHTYVYAIENYQCYAPSLHDVCVSATLNDNIHFDFVSFLTRFSNIIYPLFVWNIVFVCSHRANDFTMTDFDYIIDISNFSRRWSEVLLEKLTSKVNGKSHYLQNKYPDMRNDWEETDKRLRKLGVTPDTTYLYIQGHHLFNKLVMPMISSICNSLVLQREKEIGEQSKHEAQYNTEITSYKNSITGYNIVLKKNIGFTESEPYKKMIGDLQKYVVSLEASSCACNMENSGEGI